MQKRTTPRIDSASKSWGPSNPLRLGRTGRLFCVLLGIVIPSVSLWAAPPAAPPQAAAASEGSVEDYQLGPGDVVEIAVWQQPDLTRVVTVSQDGKIFFPPLMELSVIGMTSADLDRTITEGLKREYLKDPEVFISIREYNSHEVLVLGRVPRPGLFKLRGNTTLLGLLSQAGGITVDEVGDRLVVLRSPSQGQQTEEEGQIVIDLKKLLVDGDLKQNIPIRAGDRIFVPGKEKASVYVLGQVKNPGDFPYTDGLKVFEAIMAAGGPSEDASLSKVRIIRAGEPKGNELRANLSAFTKKGKTEENIPLAAGDFVIVPTGLF